MRMLSRQPPGLCCLVLLAPFSTWLSPALFAETDRIAQHSCIPAQSREMSETASFDDATNKLAGVQKSRFLYCRPGVLSDSKPGFDYITCTSLMRTSTSQSSLLLNPFGDPLYLQASALAKSFQI